MNEQEHHFLWTHFNSLQDHRIRRHRKYELIEIIAISVCAVICGAQGWNDIENFGKSKEVWLKKFLDLKNGVPSHDTFRRFFSNLSISAFEEAFRSWIGCSYLNDKPDDVLAIDGKTLRRSFQKKRTTVHIVSAWSVKDQVVVAQEKVEDKSCELMAIKSLLRGLPIRDRTITIDALGCQTEITDIITKSGSFYILSLKANQPMTLKKVKHLFDKKINNSEIFSDENTYFSGESRRARKTQRTTFVIRGKAGLRRWADLKSVILIKSIRNGKSEERYFISNLNCSAEKFSEIIRSHWGIENKLHWSLDVSFHEDDSRLRYKYSAQNFSLLRRISLNLIRQNKATQGISARRRQAGWDEKFLTEILNGVQAKFVVQRFSSYNLFLSPASYKESLASTQQSLQ